MTDLLRPNGSLPGAVPVKQWPQDGTRKANGHGRKPAFPLKLYRDFHIGTGKQWLVKDFLGAGEFSIFFGEPGAGKSVLIGDLALHVAAGLDWQGHAVRRGLAVYIALERPALVERRALAFRVRTECVDIPFVIMRGPIDFTAKGTAGTLKAVILEAQAMTRESLALVVVDTVSIALSGADENSSAAMGAFVATVHALQAAFPEAHMLAAHHQPHDAARLRGHGALLGAVDTTVEVSGKKEELRSATVRKANDGPEGSAVHFRLESVSLAVDENGNATDAPFVVGVETAAAKRSLPKPKLTPAAKIALDALRDTVIDLGKEPPFSNRIPSGAKAVTVEQWRNAAYLRGIASTGKPRARQVAFQRAMEQLAAQQCVGICEPFIWLAR